MATQALSSVPRVTSDKVRAYQHQSDMGYRPHNKNQSPVYIPPNEFRMKLLKRILSVDGTIDNKALQKLQKSSTDKTLQANILFQNGDVGTLISFDRLSENMLNENFDEEEHKEETKPLPSIAAVTEEQVEKPKDKVKKERPLKLPPIMLPPVYRLEPKPLFIRDFSGPPFIPPEPTDDDWDEMEDCRYLRPARKQFRAKEVNKSFLL